MSALLPVALSFAWYLLTMATVYLVMPIRSAFLMVNFGPAVLPWTFMANAVTTGIVVWLYGRWAHLPRKKLVGGTLGVLWSTLIVWWVAVVAAPKVGWVSFLFSVWTDIFVIMAVTVLWSTIDDIFSLKTAGQRYGLIASAGPLGAIVGSFVGKALIHRIGHSGLMLLAAGVFASVFPIFAALDRWAASTGPKVKEAKPVRKLQSLSQFVEVGRAIARSRLLLLITAIACFECVVPNLMTYILNTAMALAYPKMEDMVEAFAVFFLWTNSIAFLVSIALTSVALRFLGVGGTMAACSLVSLGGFALFAAWPTLMATAVPKALEDTLRFTWYRAAKESIYTVAPREVVYRVKAHIEVFIYRMASGGSGLLLLVLTGDRLLGLGPAAVALVGVPLAVGWTVAILYLDRAFARMKEEPESIQESIP